MFFFKPFSKLNLGTNPSFFILLILGTLILVLPLVSEVFFYYNFFFSKILDNL